MKKPEKGMITHQDTDETVVLGVLSAVIFFFTVLTISSYADNQTALTDQNLITENTISIKKEQKQTIQLINTTEDTKETPLISI